MLFRLLLTLSVVGAWSLPALGFVGERGGGAWRDSEGREGKYVSRKSAIGVGCTNRMGRRGCSPHEVHHYNIELDDGRSEEFRWKVGLYSNQKIRDASSGSGAIEMKFVKTADSDERGTIIIVDGDYTLILVEEKITGLPNSIVYKRSSLYPPPILDELRKLLQDSRNLKRKKPLEPLVLD